MAVSPWCTYHTYPTYPLEPVEPLSASTGFMWNKLQGCAVFCFSWFRRRFCKKLATQCHRMPKKEILCALNRVSLSHTFTFFPWNFCQERGLKSKLLSMCTEGLLPRLVSEMLHAVHWRSPNCRTFWHFFWTNMSAESVGIFGCAVLKFMSESTLGRPLRSSSPCAVPLLAQSGSTLTIWKQEAPENDARRSCLQNHPKPPSTMETDLARQVVVVVILQDFQWSSQVHGTKTLGTMHGSLGAVCSWARGCAWVRA